MPKVLGMQKISYEFTRERKRERESLLEMKRIV